MWNEGAVSLCMCILKPFWPFFFALFTFIWLRSHSICSFCSWLIRNWMCARFTLTFFSTWQFTFKEQLSDSRERQGVRSLKWKTTWILCDTNRARTSLICAQAHYKIHGRTAPNRFNDDQWYKMHTIDRGCTLFFPHLFRFNLIICLHRSRSIVLSI